MKRIVILGMDLSGKSLLTNELSEELGVNKRKKLLTPDKSTYIRCVEQMRNNNLSDVECLELFYEIYVKDYETFLKTESEKTDLLIQDNFGIIRNTANFYYKGYNIDKLLAILSEYPIPETSFFLTCSDSERMRRLEERLNFKEEDIYEKILREDLELFKKLETYTYQISKQLFNCEILDNSNITLEESKEHVLQRVLKK